MSSFNSVAPSFTSEKASLSEHRIIIFDGVCNLCESSVNFVIRRDRSAKFRFATAQSEVGRQLQRQYGIHALDAGTLLLIKNGTVYTRSAAAVEIARDLDDWWRYLAWLRFVPRPLRDGLYSFVAKRRYRWFGRKGQCMVPTPERRDRFL